MSGTYDGALKSRKGKALLHRLSVSEKFESTVEERTVRLLDVAVQVVNVNRAESVAVFLPDGTVHTYTPDFTVKLNDGRTLSLECKPVELLPALLEQEEAAWHARGALLGQMNRPLYIVTEEDLPETWLAHERLYASFIHAPVHSQLRQQALSILSERGAMPLEDLRAYLRGINPSSGSHVDSTLYALLARHQLIADVTQYVPQCLIDCPDRSLPWPSPPVGRPLKEVMARPVRNKRQERSQLPPVTGDEIRFHNTKRGEKYLRLFSMYADPSVPLSSEQVAQLTQKVQVSSRTLYRFRQALVDAGAPGILFGDLVPFLTSAATQRPKRQVNARVAIIIEQVILKHWFVVVGTQGRASSISQLHRLVRQACIADELEPPVYNTVKAFVHRIQQRDPVEAALLRHGREAAQALEPRQGRLDVRLYGELISMDCTPCDAFTVAGEIDFELRRHGRGPGQRRPNAKRGSVVTITEVATTEVLYSGVFEGSITANRVLRALQKVFLEKGLPTRLRIDSGSEFMNKQVSRVLAHLSIEVLPRNKWSRHHGGLEERTIQSLVHLHHILPGTSMNNINNRAGYDAQRGAVLTIEELNQYHQGCVQRHNALCPPLSGLTRSERAQNLVDRGLSVWRPPNDRQEKFLRTRMHPQEMRKCRRDGIDLNGLKYTSMHLGPLIVRGATVEVFYNPDDVRFAHAVHPDTNAFIQLQARLPEQLEELDRPISLQEWDELKKRFATAERTALDRVKAPQQILAEVLEAGTASQKRQRKGASLLDVTSLEPAQVEELGAPGRIRAAKIKFEHNPPTPS